MPAPTDGLRSLGTTPRSLILATLLTVILWQCLDTWTSLRELSLELSSDCLCYHKQRANIQSEELSFRPPQVNGRKFLSTTFGPTPKYSNSKKNALLKYPPGRQYLKPNLKPHLGRHRPDVDAVFAMATGYDIDDHLITISSLLETNFLGDVVLGVQPWSNCSTALQIFLKYHAEHSNVVVYTIPPCQVTPGFSHLRCFTTYAYVNPFYYNKPASHVKSRHTGTDLGGRHQSPRKFRYEYYWMWQRHYSEQSRIWLVDFRDLVFQANPMDHWSLQNKPGEDLSTTLHLFEESELRRINEVDRFTGKMIQDFYGPGMVELIGNQTVLCSGVTMGGKTAIEQYLLLMMWHMDNLLGNKVGKGDQAHHNVLYYMGEMAAQEGIDTIMRWKNFQGAVATTGYTFRAEGINGGTVLDRQGRKIPIVHQFDRSRSLNSFFQRKRVEVWLPAAQRVTGHNITLPKGQRKPS